MSVSILEDNVDSIGLFYENEIYEETIQDVWDNCILPSAESIFHIIYKIILVNIIFSIVVGTVQLPQTAFHLLSGASGIYLISNLESKEGKIVLLVFFSSAYIVLFISNYKIKHLNTSQNYITGKIRYLSTSNVIKYALIVTLVLCEYLLLKTDTWMEIRGVVMIFSMKLISLAEDIDKEVIVFPSYFRYFGYIFCGANILFGPWISFQEYILMFHQPTQKNVWWILAIARALVISLFFLMLSNCWSSYLITEDSNRWLIGYREALTFRTSHYFISFLSEASVVAAGFKNYKIWQDPQKWRFEVVDPLKIEFPTALAVVVTNWNKPMHEFLKKYVFRSWLPLGKFYGILATFIISSFLHGFELKVSVVLISIGLCSYLQFAVRDYFAKAFNCCIRVYPCKEICHHKFTRNSLFSLCSRLFFSFTSIIHLIYLGMIMDPTTDEIGIIDKWKNLYFVGFWLMLVNILIIM